jgi:hypothetical protein
MLKKLAVGFLSSFLCLLASSAWAQQLSFNGAAFNPASGQVLLTPGVANRVELVLPQAGTLRVRWELTTPQGETRREELGLPAGSPGARWDLGPLVAPPEYVYEAGQVFQRGYRLAVRLLDESGRTVRVWSFHQEHGSQPSDHQQGMGERDPLAQRIRLAAGEKERVIYNPRFGALGPLSLRLGETVLSNQDDLEIQVRLNAGEVPEGLQCILRVTGLGGKDLWRREVQLTRGAGWTSFRPDASKWPAGHYSVELQPVVEGRAWADGLRLGYKRRSLTGREVLVSPVGPWTLERDPDRPDLRIVDFRAEHRKSGAGDVAGWRWIEGTQGAVAAASDGNFSGPPLVLRPAIRGYHAVFANVDGGNLIQVGRGGLIRAVSPSRLSQELFLEATDLSDNEIRVYPSRDPKSKLVSLKLIPVTADSARKLAADLANPPVPLLSVNDWAEYFGESWTRLLPDQFTSIVCAQAEFGFRTVGWSVGRSWVEYPSQLPNARIFPCVPYEEAKQSPSYPKDTYDYGPRIVMMNQHDPLAGALEGRKGCQAEVWPWLGMQRHYGESYYGGIFSCPFYRQHPEWRRVDKTGKPAGGLSFYFPEVRKERVDILVEVVERGADGVLVGCDRQAPMLLYEPAMVDDFQRQTGIDARTIDVSHGAPYEKWIRFRAGFFTETLRELRRRLEPVASKRGKRVPVGIRIPAGGLLVNLAQGLDVETWCREGLIDLLDIDPLQEFPVEGSQDLRPYLSLARGYGIPVYAGVGSTAFRDLRMFGLATWTHSVLTPGLKRARGLHRSDLDGLDTFETEMLAWTDPARFAVALYGHPEMLERFLLESNIEAVYPIDAGTAAAGHDNHSVWRPGWTWSLAGFGAKSL